MAKSVTLNKGMKERMFHTFYRKATKSQRERIEEKIAALRDDWAKLLFGEYQPVVSKLPEPFRNEVEELAIPRGVQMKAPKKRTKGKIEPTAKDKWTLQSIPENCHLWPENWRPGLVIRADVDYLEMPESNPVYGPAWDGWVYRSYETLVNKATKEKVISKARIDAFIRTRFIPTCQEADEIIKEVEDAVLGVAVILKAARTTKALREQWPEVDDYVELPVESKGTIARLVDIHHVNQLLEKTWPREEGTA